MATSVENLRQRTLEPTELLGDLLPSAIALATMLRHRNMTAWLRQEYDGYTDAKQAPPYRRQLPGEIVGKPPQATMHGWVSAPVNYQQSETYARPDLLEPARRLERLCLGCKKGDGHHVQMTNEDAATLKKELNLTAELAIYLDRDVYSKLVRTIRGGLYLWLSAVQEAGLTGERNQFTREEKEKVAHLDTPEEFWRQAMADLDTLPIPDVRSMGIFERLFNRTG